MRQVNAYLRGRLFFTDFIISNGVLLLYLLILPYPTVAEFLGLNTWFVSRTKFEKVLKATLKLLGNNLETFVAKKKSIWSLLCSCAL